MHRVLLKFRAFPKASFRHGEQLDLIGITWCHGGETHHGIFPAETNANYTLRSSARIAHVAFREVNRVTVFGGENNAVLTRRDAHSYEFIILHQVNRYQAGDVDVDVIA